VLRWLENNWVSLALSLLLGFTVWTIAALDENPIRESEYGRPLDVEITDLDPSLVITNDYTRQAMVTLRAPNLTWIRLTTEDITVWADLSGLGPGSHQVPLKVHVVGQAKFISARPPAIRVTLEEQGEREVPVHLVLSGQPPIGYRAGSATLEPRVATVRGAGSWVDRVSEVRASVSLEGLRETLDVDLPALALDSEGEEVKGLTLDPEQVHLHVPVTQDARFKEVSVVVRTLGEPAPGYFVSGIATLPLTITVRGDPSLISQMPGYVETLPLDLTGLHDDLTRQVGLQLPPGVIPVQQELVEVQITVAAQAGSRTVRRPLVSFGLDKDLSAIFSPDKVDVILSGPLPELDALDEGDIVVSVDLTGRGSGRHQLTPRVEVTSGEIAKHVTIKSINPATIEVEIAPATASRGTTR
jgi:YbbR domain-containing protein